MISLGKNVTHDMLSELEEHNTLLLASGYVSWHLAGENRTHPPQH